MGAVQGLTEFLPISSSGHLVLIQKFIPGFSQPGILFDVILHFGTLFAVIYLFRKKIFALTPKYLLLLVLGSIPAALAGFLFRREFEEMFKRGTFLGIEFLITGILNFLVDIPSPVKTPLSVKNSLLIGIAQAVSIIPGISRSGATIFTGVRLGIDRKSAAEYSFLLSVPAIFGANLLEIFSQGFKDTSLPQGSYLAGFLVSFIVGIFSIKLVMKFLLKSQFKFFAYYALALGLAILLLQ